jgi:hypothetical protein
MDSSRLRVSRNGHTVGCRPPSPTRAVRQKSRLNDTVLQHAIHLEDPVQRTVANTLADEGTC